MNLLQEIIFITDHLLFLRLQHKIQHQITIQLAFFDNPQIIDKIIISDSSSPSSPWNPLQELHIRNVLEEEQHFVITLDTSFKLRQFICLSLYHNREIINNHYPRLDRISVEGLKY